MLLTVVVVAYAAVMLWLVWNIDKSSAQAAQEAAFTYRRLSEMDRRFGVRLRDFTLQLHRIETAVSEIRKHPEITAIRESEWDEEVDSERFWKVQEYAEQVLPLDPAISPGPVERVDWDDVKAEFRRRYLGR